jgi:ParB family chromosome partitioning protein
MILIMIEPYSNSIFWIEAEKIRPNPYQPRREFDPSKLEELADSIRRYGVLQPLVVSRIEIERPDGGLAVEYELIAGERRWRASKLAGLAQIPAVIRDGDDSKMKLELAIIENLQREDLNAVDRARAFLRLAEEFSFTHSQIGQKVGKSREYVSNSIRLLGLSEDMLKALSEGKITEGHTRPILMLSDQPEEQMTLFKEIMFKKLTVREAESFARHVAAHKVRKKNLAPDPEMLEIEKDLREALGTRVQIEKREVGGHITIHFFSNDELKAILENIMTGNTAAGQTSQPEESDIEEMDLLDDRTNEEKVQSEEDLYNIKNFSI